MRKIILILLVLSSFGFAKSVNTDQLGDELIKEAAKEAVEEPGFAPRPTPITAESIGIDSSFVPHDVCEDYNDLSCPAAAPGYSVRLHTADLKSGKVECLVYVASANIDRAMANYSYTNKACANRWAKDKNAPVSAAVSASAKRAAEQQKEIEAIQTSFRDRAAGVNEEQLNVSDLLIAAFTLDSSKIDLVQSITDNTVKLQPGFTAIVDNGAVAGGISDLAAQGLGDRITILFDFFSWVQSTIDTALFMSMLGFLFAASIKTFLSFKMLSEEEREKGKKDFYKYLATVAAAMLFFVFPSVEFNIGTDKYITSSPYQLVMQSVFGETSKMANKVNIAVHDAILKNEIKQRGFRSSSQLYDAAQENEKLEPLVALNRAALDSCKAVYPPERIKQYGGGSSTSYLYPLSEEELHKSWVVNNPNATTSPYTDLTSDAYRSNAAGLGITLSLCGKIEREYAVNRLKLATNLQTINGNNEQAYTHRDFLNARLDEQYRAVQNFGFVSVALLPLTLAQLELENTLVTALTAEEKAGGEKKSVAEDFIYRLPNLIIPGAFKIAEYIGNAAGSWFDDIPFIGGLFQGAAWAGGVYIASIYGSIIILVLPYLIISFAALLFAVLLFADVLTYFISGFFAILLALWGKSQDSVYGFLGRGVVIIMKIITYPASILFSLYFFWMVRGLMDYFLSSFANQSEATILWIVLQIFAGLCSLLSVIAAVYAAYYTMQNLFAKILGNLGIKADNGFADAVQKIRELQQQTKSGAGNISSSAPAHNLEGK